MNHSGERMLRKPTFAGLNLRGSPPEMRELVAERDAWAARANVLPLEPCKAKNVGIR